MAVRIELFTIAGTVDVEVIDRTVLDRAVAEFDAPGGADDLGPVRCVGWLSASDEDEAYFTGWCERVDDDLGVSFLRQGIGEDRGLEARAVPLPVGEPDRSWSATLHGALEAAGGKRIAWRTNFDPAGTVGTPHDYPTAHHGGDEEPPATVSGG